MRVAFKNKMRGGKIEYWSITELVDQASIYGDSEVQDLHLRIKAMAGMCEKLIEKLYSKGVLDDSDIKELTATPLFEFIEVVKESVKTA